MNDYFLRGVVQLFNAVRKQQKTVEDEVQMAGSERKKEKVMEKVTKHQFLSMLKGSSVSNVTVEKNTDNLEKVGIHCILKIPTTLLCCLHSMADT